MCAPASAGVAVVISTTSVAFYLSTVCLFFAFGERFTWMFNVIFLSLLSCFHYYSLWCCRVCECSSTAANWKRTFFSLFFFSLTHVYVQTMCGRKRAVDVHLMTAADVKTTVPPTTKQRFFWLFSRRTVLLSQGSVFFNLKYTEAEGWKLMFDKTKLAKESLVGEHLNR